MATAQAITSNVTLAADEELQKIVRRVYKIAVLAAEKAVAHQADPGKFLMPPDPDALERIMLDRLGSRPAFQQARAAAYFGGSFEASQQVRARRMGSLGRIDLRRNVPVLTQAKRLPAAATLSAERLETMLPHGPVFTGHDLPLAVETEPQEIDFSGFVKDENQLSQKKLARYQEILETIVELGLIEKKVPLPNFKPWSKLRLRILKTKCVDETNPETGDDEIRLGGYMIDPSGDMKQVGILNLGDSFDDGESITYNPPKIFGVHTLDPESIVVDGQTIEFGWPRTYMATLILSEADNGGFPKFLNALLEKLRDVVKAEVAAAVGAGVGGLIGVLGGPLGAAVGAAIGAAIGLLIDMLIDFFKSIWEDDVFVGVTLSQQLPLPIPPWGKATSPVGKVWWKGHGGHYQVYYDWEMLP